MGRKGGGLYSSQVGISLCFHFSLSRKALAMGLRDVPRLVHHLSPLRPFAEHHQSGVPRWLREKGGSAPNRGGHSTVIVQQMHRCSVNPWWFGNSHQQVIPRSQISGSTFHFSNGSCILGCLLLRSKRGPLGCSWATAASALTLGSTDSAAADPG